MKRPRWSRRDTATRIGTRRSVSKTTRVSSSSGASGRRAPVILLRKMYHALAAVTFAPATLPRAATAAAGFALPPPELLVTAYGAALVLFAALEVARAERVEIRVGRARLALGEGLHAFAKKFMDERDGEGAGIVPESFSLLAGSAAPLWLTAAGAAPRGRARGRARGRRVEPSWRRFLGIVTLGLGDAAGVGGGAAEDRSRTHAHLSRVEKNGGGCRLGCRRQRAGLVGGVDGGDGRRADAELRPCWSPPRLAALEAAGEQMDNAFLPLHHLALTGLAARCLVGRGIVSVRRRDAAAVIHPSTRRVDDNSKYLKILIHEPSARRASSRPAALDGASIAVERPRRISMHFPLSHLFPHPRCRASVRTFLRGARQPASHCGLVHTHHASPDTACCHPSPEGLHPSWPSLTASRSPTSAAYT